LKFQPSRKVASKGAFCYLLLASRPLACAPGVNHLLVPLIGAQGHLNSMGKEGNWSLICMLLHSTSFYPCIVDTWCLLLTAICLSALQVALLYPQSTLGSGGQLQPEHTVQDNPLVAREPNPLSRMCRFSRVPILTEVREELSPSI
jgi:hypothetical protein